MMRNCLALLAMIAVPAAPALAQTAPPEQQLQTPAPQQKMVKKMVCERVNIEEETGSRLRAAPKKCKVVEVPATEQNSKRTQSDAQRAAPQGQASGLTQ
jgi:hypothetical protein